MKSLLNFNDLSLGDPELAIQCLGPTVTGTAQCSAEITTPTYDTSQDQELPQGTQAEGYGRRANEPEHIRSWASKRQEGKSIGFCILR